MPDAPAMAALHAFGKLLALLGREHLGGIGERLREPLAAGVGELDLLGAQPLECGRSTFAPASISIACLRAVCAFSRSGARSFTALLAIAASLSFCSALASTLEAKCLIMRSTRWSIFAGSVGMPSRQCPGPPWAKLFPT